MKKSGLWKMVCLVCLFCAAMAVNSSAQTLTTLVSFDGTNGSAPAASLIQARDGNLYGTTEYGGPISGCEGGFNPCGTVFKITLSGTLTTLHTFVYSDGAFPVSPVVQGTDGNFYGTNQGEGDSGGAGAIFKMTPGGTVTVLSFTSSPAGLVQDRDGNFYGTTPRSYTDGTVFKITPSGTLTTLHTFDGTDGNNPQAGVIQATDGNFYGTTFSGGTSNYCVGGCGTVFKMTPGGSLTTLHSFSGTDGYNVYAGLVEGTDGNFYGTTFNGGAHNVGEVYKITPSGTLTVLYTFCSQTGCTDGDYPRAALMQATDGNFYGTTFQGGAYGQGTVFAITPSGSLTTLYSFCPQSGCADGANPIGGVIQASNGNFYGTTYNGGNNNAGTVFGLVKDTLTVSVGGDGTVASTDGFIHCPGTCSHTYPPNTPVTLDATPGQGWVFGGWNGACLGTSSCSVTMTQPLSVDGIFSQALQFVPVTPCRLIDTRLTGGPIQGGTSQIFNLPQLAQSASPPCASLASAEAYSLNVSVVPQGPLGYLTIWPTGESQPVVATLNSLDGRIKADAAIVPAGTSGAVSIYVTNTTNVVLDINGYFEPVSGSTLAFYPLTPCRIADTRKTNFPQGLGAPFLPGHQERDFPILNATSCNIPSSAEAYSLNFSVVPHGGLGYLTVWPTGQTRPLVSTLNDVPGTIIANAAIVPAGSSGNVSVYPSNDTDVIIDINGYFGPAGLGGLSLYPAAPCRVIDTRHVGSGQPFSGTLTPPVNVVGSQCEPPATAKAYVFNATVVPTGALGYLTLWPDGDPKPLVSTLNALDGSITNNMAIVPSSNGKVDAFASGITQLILDISSYFAP
ncbi:MAG: choice-of-anchor tandem repeat GloVer-containing protein [Candidatus Korobacteraceae bacterium]